MKKNQGKFYLTTAIAYVNAPPHIGHALEFIQADALARFYRLCGDEVYFLTGTDEHGVKIYETAKEKGVSTLELVNQNAAIYQSLGDKLTLSNDDFIRTTEERHKEGAAKIWRKMFEKGDIYKGVYKGNYCVGCEAFILDKDLDENGECPFHKKKPEILEEENYFFRLSKYSEQIKKAILSGELKILPEARKNEMLNIIGEEGLSDVSFSRPKAVLPWGIEVPGDDTQVMYVWCDALSNYITALDYAHEGELYQKFWPADAHMIGKDILRFHAGIWIGMLMSAGLSIPKAVYVHGFVTGEGQKMSKSLGNVVDPLVYVEKYGIDALRWYLLREIPTTDDGDFSDGRFLDVYNSELCNGLGNLVNRVVMMIEKYADGKVPAPCECDVLNDLEALVRNYRANFEKFDIRAACENFLALINLTNKYIDDKKPWIMAKKGDKKLDDVLYHMIELVRYVCVLVSPMLPGAAGKIAGQLGLKVDDFDLNLQWGDLKNGAVVKRAELLFARVD
ncbi:methionine--tRNA ligase [Candidatus Peregrinibacteria bacterium]|nr:methionine--tRNA ligase [Candidatus Peregrinibacteria bacterium]